MNNDFLKEFLNFNTSINKEYVNSVLETNDMKKCELNDFYKEVIKSSGSRRKNQG